MERLDEFSKHIYTFDEVVELTKNNKYCTGKCKMFEVYHAYVGRHDQPDVYDKRACMILEDLGDQVSVYKITDEHRDHPLRYLLTTNSGLNFKGPSYVRLDEDPYVIDKKWITMFDGDIKLIDIIQINKMLKL